jgi:hypothetical protein
MFKRLLSFAFGIVLFGAVGLGVEYWLAGGSVEQLSRATQAVMATLFNRLKTTAIPKLPFSSIAHKASADDHSDPKANPDDWDSISDRSQICWVHRKTRRKVCEKRQ